MVEVLGGGQMAIIDDFRSVTTAGRGKSRTVKAVGKGYAQEAIAFAQSIRSGGAGPIPWLHLRDVSLASILAVRSLREGIPFDLAGADAEPH